MDPNNDKEDGCDRLVINVSGAIFEISEKKLVHFPQTLLGSPQNRQKYFDAQRKQYFFDRHRQAFEGILFYYQTEGRLINPDNVPTEVFDEEVKFFMLPVEKARQKALETAILGDRNRSRPLNAWQRKLWELFEFPNSSMPAKVLAVFSQIIIAVSLASSCLRTVESLRSLGVEQAKYVEENNSSRSAMHLHRKPASSMLEDDKWFPFDLLCYSWFTVECAVRLLASSNKGQYFKLLPNCADFMTIVLFYLELIVKITWPSERILVRLLETLTVVRILKFVRYCEGMKVLILTVAAGLWDLGLVLTFAATVVILGSSAVFFVETSDEDHEQFKSIPDTFWWAIITICTVGYGDKVPTTLLGKLFGATCAVLGTVTLALPLFRFAAHFRTQIESSTFVTRPRDPSVNFVKAKKRNIATSLLPPT